MVAKDPAVTLLDEVDPRLQPVLRAEWERRRGEPVEALPCDVTVVLAGHRAAGKTQMLPPVARALGRDAVDLDAELARRHDRPLREWVENDERDFRAAERETFRSPALGPGGGGRAAGSSRTTPSCCAAASPSRCPSASRRTSSG